MIHCFKICNRPSGMRTTGLEPYFTAVYDNDNE